jgi:uncharacterized protein YbjT (DUF2867 family)
VRNVRGWDSYVDKLRTERIIKLNIMFVVVGATGKTGQVVAESLLAHRKPVTVLVRDADKASHWRTKGANVSVSSLEDVKTLTALLTGAEGAYLLLPPNNRVENYLADRARLADGIARAVAKSGVAHLVLLSSIGADRVDGTGLLMANHNAEAIIAPASRNITILRAAYFLENWGASVGAVRETGTLYTFLRPGTRIPMVSTLDIGRLAAENLLNPKQGSHTLELSGPQEYAPEDIAQEFQGELGRPIAVQGRPLESIPSRFASFGFSTDVANLYRGMYEAVDSGLVTWSGSGQSHRGIVTERDVVKRLLAR